jgi:Ca2+-binding EF-hand superfamily protein
LEEKNRSLDGEVEMTPKHLEIDSAYNEFDTNGDGIVSEKNCRSRATMLQIENNDKMQDQQA